MLYLSPEAIPAEVVVIRELCERFLSDYAEGRKKPSSILVDRRMIKRFIIPALGNRKVAEVTRPDILKLHNSLRDTPYQANRLLALMSKMFNLAERWGFRPEESNPCLHVEKFPERHRERFLSADELMRLGDVLEDMERTPRTVCRVEATVHSTRALTANAILDVIAYNVPAHGGRITTRISQVLGAPFCFRECIFSVVGNHPIGGTTSLFPVNI